MPVEIDIINIIFTITGFIFVTFMGAIGYFLKVFGISVKELKQVVQQLSIMVSVIDERIKSLKETNDKLHEIEYSSSLDIYEKIDGLNKRLVILETKFDNK